MDVTMSQNSKNEYLKKMRWRYARRTGKAGKSALIDEFCEVCGYERKYAIKLLGGRRRAPGATKRKVGRKATYDQTMAPKLKEIWMLAEQPCGKRLKPVLPIWLRSYEKRHGRLGSLVRSKLLKISPAQIDRVLAPYQAEQPKRAVLPPRNNALKEATPVRAETWNVNQPGWLECDTVAHCGGAMDGSFLWSLCGVDIFSGWTEVGVVWNCGQHAVCERFGDLERRLPFPLKGVDTDNGGEFLNWHFHRHFQDRDPAVELTRSRPYRKNDQAYVEQKNYTHVRQLLGYDRLEHEELVKPIDQLLELWSKWRNLYSVTMKQQSRTRQGSRLIRRHEKTPQTPCQRLMDYWREQGDKKRVNKLKSMMKENDPIAMKEEIERRLAEVARQKARLESGAPSSRPSPLRSEEREEGAEPQTTNPKKTKRASVSSVLSQRQAA